MDTAASLCVAIEAHRSKHGSPRYPDELRCRIAAFARQQQAVGIQPWQVAQDIGIGQGTIQKMLEEQAPARLLPVKVIASMPARSIVVHGYHGVRVEGLGVHEVAKLLRALA